jgi:acetyl-CoA C-acetyltransferase
LRRLLGYKICPRFGGRIFLDEILPILVSTERKTPSMIVGDDEHPRPESDLAALEKLKPLFEGFVVTAGNASGINDAAAALFIGSKAVSLCIKLLNA